MPAAFARALHVNLTARWWLSQACLPLLAKAPDAALVFTVDDLSRVGQAYWGGYGLSQQGLSALVGMLHAEFANSAVRGAGLQPGPQWEWFTLLLACVGVKLPGLEFHNQRVEAAYRKELVLGEDDAGADYPMKAESRRQFCDFWGEAATSPRRHQDPIQLTTTVRPQ